MNPPFLQLNAISKTYPGVAALDGVSLFVRSGEVIGLVGENGAGKSTLMKILGGVVRPSHGHIEVDGAIRSHLDVASATEVGIAFVHQELNLFDNLDAAANIFIGREPLKGGVFKIVDEPRLHAMARPFLERVGADFLPHTLVAELSIAQRQLLEIAKALSLEARLVIMDEPTSSLTLAETERLLAIVADLKSRGVSIIFISHRLNELVACATRVVVLRDGKMAGELAKHEISTENMIRLMIGRDLKSLYIPPASEPGENVLQLKNVGTAAYPHGRVDLTIRRGEILGFAGLIGAGRTELARAIFGIDRLAAGEIYLDGRLVNISTPRQAIAQGIFLVPEDRKRSGLLLDASICDNIVLPDLWRFATAGLVGQGQCLKKANADRLQLNIRTPDVRVEVAALSGGNQQKVVLAKWLSMNPRVLICDEPTRGVDVQAKNEIYRMLRALADAGVGILVISSDMEEVIGISDRIAVLHEGRLTGILMRPDFSEQNVLRLAVGHN